MRRGIAASGQTPAEDSESGRFEQPAAVCPLVVSVAKRGAAIELIENLHGSSGNNISEGLCKLRLKEARDERKEAARTHNKDVMRRTGGVLRSKEQELFRLRRHRKTLALLVPNISMLAATTAATNTDGTGRWDMDINF